MQFYIFNHTSYYTMKFFFNLLILMLVTLLSNSQEYIVPHGKDTIPCEILMINRKNLTIKEVKDGISIIYKVPRKNLSAISELVSKSPEKRFVFQLKSGLSFRFGDIDPAIDQLVRQGVTRSEAKEYYQSQKKGYNVSASAHYLLNSKQTFRNHGLGVKYRFFSSKSSYNGTFDPQDNVHLLYGELKEDIFIQFYGLSWMAQERSANEKWFYSSAFNMGVASYRDELSHLNTPRLITGSALAYELEIAAQYFISQYLSVQLATSLFSSKLKKVKQETYNHKQTVELDKDHYENLSALDICLGFSFFF
ncbi:hypothetical protein EMN47_00150 [Prolixibacteraceae bacterium JC049]|nr:hypothetical protein [Prolixibacteraceae bacterium JC049]